MVIDAGTRPKITSMNNQANFYQNKSLELKVKMSSFKCIFMTFSMTVSVVYNTQVKADQ